jgi:hypothetical protein
MYKLANNPAARLIVILINQCTQNSSRAAPGCHAAMSTSSVRTDGRTAVMMRQLKTERGLLTRADGSARWEQGVFVFHLTAPSLLSSFFLFTDEPHHTRPPLQTARWCWRRCTARGRSPRERRTPSSSPSRSTTARRRACRVSACWGEGWRAPNSHSRGPPPPPTPRAALLPQDKQSSPRASAW